MRQPVRDALRSLASEGRVDSTLRELVEALGGYQPTEAGWPEEVNVNIKFHGADSQGATDKLFARIILLGERIMTAISDFADKTQGFFDSVAASVDGLTADVQGLKDMIEELQNNPGPITPEDQALLDQIQSRAEELSSRLGELDAMTPPVPPVEPPVPVS